MNDYPIGPLGFHDHLIARPQTGSVQGVDRQSYLMLGRDPWHFLYDSVKVPIGVAWCQEPGSRRG